MFPTRVIVFMVLLLPFVVVTGTEGRPTRGRTRLPAGPNEKLGGPQVSEHSERRRRFSCSLVGPPSGLQDGPDSNDAHTGRGDPYESPRSGTGRLWERQRCKDSDRRYGDKLGDVNANFDGPRLRAGGCRPRRSLPGGGPSRWDSRRERPFTQRPRNSRPASPKSHHGRANLADSPNEMRPWV